MTLPLVKGNEPLLPAGRNEHVTPTSTERDWGTLKEADPPTMAAANPFDCKTSPPLTDSEIRMLRRIGGKAGRKKLRDLKQS